MKCASKSPIESLFVNHFTGSLWINLKISGVNLGTYLQISPEI